MPKVSQNLVDGKPWRPCPGWHVWEPIPVYHGRYKCARCYAVGYHRLAGDEVNISDDGLHGDHRNQIVPYQCPKCHGPTTITNRSRPCPNCRVAKRHVWKKQADVWVLFNANKTRLATAQYEREPKSRWVIKIRGIPFGEFLTIPEAKEQVERQLVADGLLPNPTA